LSLLLILLVAFVPKLERERERESNNKIWSNTMFQAMMPTAIIEVDCKIKLSKINER